MADINNSDICFLIPSYNRYEKLSNLLKQINYYPEVGTIIYNDASSDNNYNTIETTYNNVTVITGDKNNGRGDFDKTIKTLFKHALQSNYKYFIVIADDMILCNDFLTHAKKFLDEHTITNLFSLSNGGWGCTAYIDGVFSISKSGINYMYNLLPNKSRDVDRKSTGVWQTVTKAFCLRNAVNYRLACLNYSLVQHDGNDDSKLHYNFRKLIPITAQNFYNDFIGSEIKIISQSAPGATISSGIHKKKRPEDTSNGKPIEVKKPEQPKTIVIDPKKAILLNSEKLYKPNKSNNPISKIGDDALLAKIRRKNTGFGGRR